MLSSTKQFIDYMDKKGVHYLCHEDVNSSHLDIVDVTYSCENIPAVSLKLIFSKSCDNVSVRASNLVKFSEDKIPAMLVAVNQQNCRFRFVKFVIDFDENTVHGEMDACFGTHDVGMICYDLLDKGVDICDKAYPELMKALWG